MQTQYDKILHYQTSLSILMLYNTKSKQKSTYETIYQLIYSIILFKLVIVVNNTGIVVF